MTQVSSSVDSKGRLISLWLNIPNSNPLLFQLQRHQYNNIKEGPGALSDERIKVRANTRLHSQAENWLLNSNNFFTPFHFYIAAPWWNRLHLVSASRSRRSMERPFRRVEGIQDQAWWLYGAPTLPRERTVRDLVSRCRCVVATWLEPLRLRA